MQTTFDQFRTIVEAAGLKARDLGNWHWQIIGGVKPVNFYPCGTNGPCLYGSGMQKGIHGKHATVDAAICLAKNGTCRPDVKVKRSAMPNNKRQRIKHRIWNRTQAHPCHWCGQSILFFRESRLDHIIPIDQGGSHREDNLCLACERCDRERGNRAINPALIQIVVPSEPRFSMIEESVRQPRWFANRFKEVAY